MEILTPIKKLQFKLLMEVGLLSTLPYFLLQNFPVFEVYEMPFSKVDVLIGFNDHSIWIYQSLYLMIIFRTFSYREPKKLIEYASQFSMAVIISSLFFMFFPTSCERPVASEANWLYKQFIQFEKPLNAFPSMHVSLVLVSCDFILQSKEFSSVLKFILVIWTLLIIYSTVLSKQHVVVDVAGGVTVWLMCRSLNSINPLSKFLESRWFQFYNKNS
jgi:membrane-associated phospholipid phosphatase